MRLRTAAVALSLWSAAPAFADDAPSISGQGWSLLGAQSTGQGTDTVWASFGFPGISAGYLHGVLPAIDVGVRVAFNYGFEGLATAMFPGVRAEAVARVRLLDTGRVSLGIRGGFGTFGYFANQTTLPGLTLPLGVTVGVPVGSAIVISSGVDVPLYLTFGSTGGITVPVLVNAGVEYFLDKRWVLELHAKAGPALNPTGFRFGRPTEVAFEISAGTALKL